MYIYPVPACTIFNILNAKSGSFKKFCHFKNWQNKATACAQFSLLIRKIENQGQFMWLTMET